MNLTVTLLCLWFFACGVVGGIIVDRFILRPTVQEDESNV